MRGYEEVREEDERPEEEEEEEEEEVEVDTARCSLYLLY